MATELSANIEAVRAFTRFYTRLIGLLDEGLLKSPYTMTEARVLFELGQRPEIDLIELRTNLGIDSGYMSRLVAGFQTKHLVTARTSPADRRRQILQLTGEGQAACRMLNERSNVQIASLLRQLSVEQQRTVATSMNTVREILDGDSSHDHPVRLRHPAAGDYGWVISRHGEIYAEEFGWDARFEALVAHIVADYVDEHDPERERCWIAERDSQPVGSVFVVRKDNEVAKLRLLLVDPVARGTGLGRRLVRECIQFAHDAGYRRLVLWTNDVLLGARHIYETEGFQLTERTPHADFGPAMVGETWELAL